MTTKNHKLPTGILILVLLGMTACASVYDDRSVAIKMVDALIIPQKFDEKTTAKVKVKNESAYSNNGAILSKEPAKNIFEIDIKF